MSASSEAGAASAPSVSANVLRRLAEAADGMRNRDLWLVDAGVSHAIMPKADADRLGHRCLIELNTPLSGSGLPGAEYNVLSGGKAYTLPDVDAIFLSQAAVEKFLLPYYLRYMSPAQVDEIRTECFASDVIAVVHEYPTVHKTIKPTSHSKLVRDAATGDAQWIPAAPTTTEAAPTAP